MLPLVVSMASRTAIIRSGGNARARYRDGDPVLTGTSVRRAVRTPRVPQLCVRYGRRDVGSFASDVGTTQGQMLILLEHPSGGESDDHAVGAGGGVGGRGVAQAGRCGGGCPSAGGTGCRCGRARTRATSSCRRQHAAGSPAGAGALERYWAPVSRPERTAERSSRPSARAHRRSRRR